MSILILALTAIVLYLGVRWFVRRAPRYGKRFLLQLLLVGLALLMLWLALSGRLHWLFALFSTLLPFARRLLPLLLRGLPWLARQRHRAGRKRSGQRSKVRTLWLDMSLDHDSGTISGRLIAGPFNGRALDDLSDTELIQLYQHCVTKDPEALKLLDSYIARHRADLASDAEPDAQQQAGSQSSGDLDIDEAYQILGLKPGASDEEVIRAHKRMMQKVHPDRGGSNYLAAKINQAKQRLLG